MNAQQAHDAHVKDAREALETIMQYLAASEAHPVGERNWPASGSMGHVADLLRNAANFVRGQ